MPLSAGSPNASSQNMSFAALQFDSQSLNVTMHSVEVRVKQTCDFFVLQLVGVGGLCLSGFCFAC